MSAPPPAPHYVVPAYVQPVWAPAPPRGLSIAGMVLGLVSIFFGLVLVLPAVGIILSILGIRREPAGRGMAITGIILNGCCLLGWVFVALGMLGLLGLAGAASTMH